MAISATFTRIQLGAIDLMSGAADPNTVVAVPAPPAGSFYCQTDGTIWSNTDGTNTGWTVAGGGGGGAAQAFTYTCTGAEGSDFFIALPVAQPDVDYIPQVTSGGVTTLYLIDCPDLIGTDRKVNEFRVETSIAVTAGDRLDVVIVART